MEKSAYERQVLGHAASAAPLHLDSEQFGGRVCHVEPAGFERRPHQFRMAAGPAFGARATPFGTVDARSDVGERASAVLPFHLQQPTFEPLPFGQDQASRFGDRESRLLGRDSGRDEQRRAVTRDVLLHIEPERRASPAAAVVATLPAIAAHPFGVAEAGDVCCGGQFRREIPGGVSKRMIHAAKL